MPKRNTKRNTKKNKNTKRKNRKTFHKGGVVIHNYPPNSYEVDPNYIQVAARNVFQQGSGKRRSSRSVRQRRPLKGGGNLDFAALQFANPITNFGSFYTTSNMDSSPAYVQPIGGTNYTGNMIKYY